MAIYGRTLTSRYNLNSVFSDNASDISHLDLVIELDSDWGKYKTPTLRGISKTAPYMHQGQFSNLAQVIQYYSTFQGAYPAGHHSESFLVPLELSNTEALQLEAFLNSL